MLMLQGGVNLVLNRICLQKNDLTCKLYPHFRILNFALNNYKLIYNIRVTHFSVTIFQLNVIKG